MLYSHLFTKTKKQAPKDEITKNAQLLVRAGFVNKLMAGVYSYLPLGVRVLRKIEAIVREEMNAIGGQEIFMPALHPAENWKKTGGWEKIDILFKIKNRLGKNYALGQSHEEVVTPLVKEYVHSYKDLPIFVYQIQQKFRDELRSKSGILRGREFEMKDMYSFHLNQKDFDKFYQKAKQAYLKIFHRCGLDAKATEASGGDFSQKISYEFMVLTDAGEDDILYCPDCDFCINEEISKFSSGAICPHCRKAKLKKAHASEVGNVFDLGQRYTKIFDFYVLDKLNKKNYPIMGCYGIGISRLMGVIAEKYNDENGLKWPKPVAPFPAYLISFSSEKEIKEKALRLYQELKKQNIEVLWDDRQVSIGEKLADADLIGLPARLVISPKTGNKIEWKERGEVKAKLISLREAIKKLH